MRRFPDSQHPCPGNLETSPAIIPTTEDANGIVLLANRKVEPATVIATLLLRKSSDSTTDRGCRASPAALQ
jgi:hypothetical protein